MYFKDNINIAMRHLIVSTLSACVEVSIFWMLHLVLGVTLLTAHVTAFTCASIIGFVLHSIMTFAIGKLKTRNAIFYCFQALIVLAIGYQIIKILVEIGINVVLAKIIQISITFMLNVFIGKKITFKK